MEDYKEHIDQQLFEQIEAYLLDKMDASDRLRFEDAMEKDSSLKREVELQRKLIATVQIVAFSNNSAEHISQNKTAAPVKSISLKWWLAAAASLLLIAAAAWFFQRTTDSPDKIFADNFFADPGMPVVMSSTNEYSFYNGMVSYKEGNYDNAIETWLGLTKSGFITDTLQYYIGVAGLNKNDVKTAVQYLQPVADNPKSEWHDKAVWYLALAYIKTNHLQDAIQRLQQLPGNSQAESLIKNLQKRSP